MKSQKLGAYGEKNDRYEGLGNDDTFLKIQNVYSLNSQIHDQHRVSSLLTSNKESISKSNNRAYNVNVNVNKDEIYKYETKQQSDYQLEINLADIDNADIK